MQAGATMRFGKATAALAIPVFVAIGWLVTLSGRRPTNTQELALAIAAGCLIASASTTLDRARLLGLFFGLYTAAYQIIGWTLGPGPLNYAITVVASAGIWSTIIGKRRLAVGEVVRDPFFLVGVAPWLVGLVGPVLAREWLVAAQRLVLANVFFAIFLAVRKHRDAVGLAWGLVAGQSIALLAVITCGVARPLSIAERAILYSPSRSEAFAGGQCATSHPNIIAILGFALFVSWLTLPGSHPLPRLFGLAAPILLLVLTDSRTGVGATILAVAAWAAARSRTGSSQFPTPGSAWLKRGSFRAMVIIFLLASGSYFIGQQFFERERAPGVGSLTGRDFIWQQSIGEIRASGGLELILGQVDAANFQIELPGSAISLRAHNAVIDILGRAGFIGLFFATVGLLLLISRYSRVIGRPGLEFSGAMILGSVATVVVENYFAGALFIWILIADAVGARHVRRGRLPPPATEDVRTMTARGT